MPPTSPPSPSSESPPPERSPVTRGVDALTRMAFRGAYLLAHVWWFARRPQAEGALVAVWCGERVLLIQNSYKPQLGMPGGGRHPDEPWDEAAARELREEVGLRVPASALRFAFETLRTEEFKHDRVRFFELEVQAEPPLALDHREVVWAAFIGREEALRLNLTPAVRAYLQQVTRASSPPSPRAR